jgi:hypothetical protein
MKKYLLLVNVLFCFQVIYCQNVGVNTPTPEAALDVNGDVIFRTSDLPVADGVNIALDVNTARFSYYRLTGPIADFTLAGITAGNDGRLLTLFNRTGFTMQINNEDAGAAVTDMIVTGTNADMTLPNKGIINLQYDATEQKWIVKSSSKGSVAGGGGFWDATGNNIFNTNTGNVGIGTNLPGTKLTIETPYNTQGWKHVGRSGVDSIVIGEAIGGVSAAIGTSTNHTMRLNSNGLGRMHIYPNGNVTVGDNNTPANDKFTVQSEAYGLTHTNGDGSITVGTYIGSYQGATGGWIGTKSNNPFNFYTNGGGAQMTLLPSGNIGIGTFSPTGRLQIDHPGPTAHLILRYPALNDYSRFLFANSGTSRYWGIAGKSSNVATSVDRLSFYTSTGVEPMAMTGDGYVTIPGKLGIGTVNSLYKFSVNGTIRSTEVIVENGWADYVFDKKYKLKSLEDVEKFIEQNKHLPGIPSAAEIEKNGLQLGDTQKKMMEKIEELTLYLIEANKQICNIKKEIESIKKSN